MGDHERVGDPGLRGGERSARAVDGAAAVAVGTRRVVDGECGDHEGGSLAEEADLPERCHGPIQPARGGRATTSRRRAGEESRSEIRWRLSVVVPTVGGVRHLPLADPGTADHRSPGRYLWWLMKGQWRTLVMGMLFGIVWMVCQAVMPAVIGHAIDDGVAARDTGALVQWTLAMLGDRRAAGGLRDHAPPVRGDQLAHRGLPHGAARRPAGDPPRRHAAQAGRHRRGRRHRHQRPRPPRQRDGRDRARRRCGRVVPGRRGDPAPRLGHPRPAGADRRARAAAADRPAAQAAPAPQHAPARDDGPALQPRHRHRQRAARPARHRRRAGLPRPLRPRLPEGPAGRRPGGPPPVAARRLPGAAARHLRGARGLDRRPVRRPGPDQPRRAGGLLRLRRVPDDPAAHGDRVRQQVDPRLRRRPPRGPGARPRARGRRPRPVLPRARRHRRARRRRERAAGAARRDHRARLGPPGGDRARSRTGSAATRRARCAGATCPSAVSPATWSAAASSSPTPAARCSPGRCARRSTSAAAATPTCSPRCTPPRPRTSSRRSPRGSTRR